MDLLYSGVANRTPWARRVRSLKATQAAGGELSESWLYRGRSPIPAISIRSASGAIAASAWTSRRVKDSRRRLPTIATTSIDSAMSCLRLSRNYAPMHPAETARSMAGTMSRPESLWPELPYEAWQETCTTLHLWTQIVGKVRLAHTPWLNHGWHVPLYVTSRGLATSPIPYGSRSFEIVFDFNTHVLDIDVNDGSSRRLALRPRTVADFYEQLMRALSELDLATSISERPCEIADATPFGRDRIHSAYDAGYAHRFWRALVQVDRVLKLFRTGFIGKSSPVHFFWGSFDLAVTRFSGRSAPPFTTPVPGLAAAVMREAYSHEVSSAGSWPGNS